MTETPAYGERRFTLRWPFRIMAGVLGAIALVIVGPIAWRAVTSGDPKEVLFGVMSIVVLAVPYLWMAFGGTKRFDRWLASRDAARRAYFAARAARGRSYGER